MVATSTLLSHDSHGAGADLLKIGDTTPDSVKQHSLIDTALADGTPSHAPPPPATQHQFVSECIGATSSTPLVDARYRTSGY